MLKIETLLMTAGSRARKKTPMYAVILHNDDYTTMDFVVMVLTDIFSHTLEQAVDTMLSVHNTGRGVAGIYTKQIAQTKMDEATELAIAEEFPLKITIEPHL